MSRNRTYLQERLDAFDAAMAQTVQDGATEDELWILVELFCELPPDTFSCVGDEAWWSERAFAIVRRFGLIEGKLG